MSLQPCWVMPYFQQFIFGAAIFLFAFSTASFLSLVALLNFFSAFSTLAAALLALSLGPCIAVEHYNSMLLSLGKSAQTFLYAIHQETSACAQL
jgi:hypothetical protein